MHVKKIRKVKNNPFDFFPPFFLVSKLVEKLLGHPACQTTGQKLKTDIKKNKKYLIAFTTTIEPFFPRYFDELEEMSVCLSHGIRRFFAALCKNV